jgi:hypothetical protein
VTVSGSVTGFEIRDGVQAFHLGKQSPFQLQELVIIGGDDQHVWVPFPDIQTQR